jgi:hypothetical protein
MACVFMRNNDLGLIVYLMTGVRRAVDLCAAPGCVSDCLTLATSIILLFVCIPPHSHLTSFALWGADAPADDERVGMCACSW